MCQSMYSLKQCKESNHEVKNSGNHVNISLRITKMHMLLVNIVDLMSQNTPSM